MEWTQIAAWVVWAWVALTTLMSVVTLIFQYDVDVDRELVLAAITAACALNAILGLMLIQTLGLTV
ncbi:hypothetical protein N9C14_03540 [Gammaproteobacteria bacterium]|jgi:hypothetical protein|nr:hypothetical protein [Gammaproteobacteria bacterium]MDB2376195.1 hypothetical protein [Gammaproteobacteria bacterium]